MSVGGAKTGFAIPLLPPVAYIKERKYAPTVHRGRYRDRRRRARSGVEETLAQISPYLRTIELSGELPGEGQCLQAITTRSIRKVWDDELDEGNVSLS